MESQKIQFQLAALWDAYIPSVEKNRLEFCEISRAHLCSYKYTVAEKHWVKKWRFSGPFLIGARDKAWRHSAEALYQPINCLNLIYCFPRRGFINTQTDTYTRLSR